LDGIHTIRLETVVIFLPFTEIFTPGIASPPSSVIFPETVRFCAETPTHTARSSKMELRVRNCLMRIIIIVFVGLVIKNRCLQNKLLFILKNKGKYESK